jgi:serine/threonine-protein kinase
LSHPNIAQVYDYGESGGTAYVVMELINGPTLQQRVSGGPLPPRTVFRICGEVAAALAAAHDEDLVHRDIKMANIMVTAAGAKVVDFGIAAAAGLAAPEEMLVGTPAYLAPERLTGDAVEPASDVYALGVLLYRLLADESPWSVETTTQMLNAHVYIDPEPLPDLPGVPPAVTDLVARCLHKRPADRPTAAEVSAILGDAAEASRELHSVRGERRPTTASIPRPANPVIGAAAEPITGEVAEGRRDDGQRERMTAGTGARSSALAGTDPYFDADPRDGADPDGAGPRDGADLGAADAGGADAGGAGRYDGGETGDGARLSGLAGVRAPSQDPPVEAGRLDAVGDDWAPVPAKNRKVIVAGGALAGLVIAVLVAFFMVRGGEAGPGRPAAGSVSVAPVRSGLGGPAPAGVGETATMPAATAGSGPGRIAGGVPLRSTSPSSPSSAAPSTAGAAVVPTPSEEQPSASPSTAAPDGTKFSSPGGVIYATCSKGKATLTSWEPAAGYEVEKVKSGPALTTEIVFKGSPDRYRTTVTCVAGLPTPVVLPL